MRKAQRRAGKRAAALALAGSLAIACQSEPPHASGRAEPAPADLVLRGGPIYTLDAARSWARALAVRDGHLVFVGTERGTVPFVGAHTRVVELDAAGRVTGFVEKPSEPRSDLAWAGLLVAESELFEAIPQSLPCDLGHDVLPRLVGRMRGVVVEGYHADVGTPENYRRVVEDFEAMAASA